MFSFTNLIACLHSEQIYDFVSTTSYFTESGRLFLSSSQIWHLRINCVTTSLLYLTFLSLFMRLKCLIVAFKLQSPLSAKRTFTYIFRFAILTIWIPFHVIRNRWLFMNHIDAPIQLPLLGSFVWVFFVWQFP